MKGFEEHFLEENLGGISPSLWGGEGETMSLQ